MTGKWKKISEKVVYDNPWLKVREDEVIKPDGVQGTYTIGQLHKGISVIPVDQNGNIWMVKHYRYIFDDIHWELVAGDIEQGENSQAAAERELFEELGLTAANWRNIGKFRPSNGSVDQVCDIWLAKGLEVAKTPTDEFDILARHTFTLGEIDQMIKNGEIVDGYVMNALYFYKLL